MPTKKFQTFGPFSLVRNGSKLDENELPTFWAGVDSKHPGLSDAIGVYIFAIKAKKQAAAKPCYVGKTDAQGFKKRFRQHLNHFREVFDYAKNGTPELFLVARMTKGGESFVKQKKTSSAKLPSIDQLESLLIDSCLDRNSRLINKSKTTFRKDMYVPGYLNDHRGGRSKSAAEFSRMLGRE